MCCLLSSCAQKNIPFNKTQWMKEKNRYFMVDSLCEKLNAEKPKRSEIFNLLGQTKLEGRISDYEVSYWLKSDGFLTVWILDIYFDGNGNFKSASVHCEN